MNKTNKTALITGASSGLGMELARLHAQNGDNLVLVARSIGKMQQLKDELEREHDIAVTIIGKDLSLPTAPEAVYYASKAYVTSLSNAIWYEAKSTDVTVTTLLPGAMDSGFTRASDMQNTKLFEHMVSPAIVARAGFDGMMKGKMTVTGGLTFMQKIFTHMTPFIPKKMLMKQIYEMQLLKK